MADNTEELKKTMRLMIEALTKAVEMLDEMPAPKKLPASKKKAEPAPKVSPYPKGPGVPPEDAGPKPEAPKAEPQWHTSATPEMVLQKALSTAKEFIQRYQKSTPDGMTQLRALLAEKFKADKIGGLTREQQIDFVATLDAKLAEAQ